MKSKTLNMPQTGFTQRSNATTREPELLSLWNNVLESRNKLNTGNDFVLHSGPPYSNGNLHSGHCLNALLKDMLCKYKLMNGYKVDFRLGWDCHGLPTELAVQKKYGSLPTPELRTKCAEFASKFMLLQQETFKSLGLLADWKNSYTTMSKEYESTQLEVLYVLLNKGLLYQDKRPVYYSPSTQTVLAESELVYKDRTDMAAYFSFVSEDNTRLLVWTTQPWTVLGNKAVCVNPNMEYCKVLYNNVTYWVGKFALNLFDNYELVETCLGQKLNGLKYTNLVTKEGGVVVTDRFVKEGNGTGLVHLCPAHGEEDYDVCVTNNLHGYDLTDKYGKVNGKFCMTECTEDVLEKMLQENVLFRKNEYTHSYPHDWRTGGVVYYKLTEQFFLELSSLREQALKVLDDVEFNEKRWENRLRGTLVDRTRWCLSRQRKWGFPLAVFLKDGKPFLSASVENHLTNLFSEYGSNVWFDKTADELLPDEFKELGLSKCEHTLDVWFDSGVSWKSVLGGNMADVYLEGSDQHRGWFQSSLLTSVAVRGKAPYKKLVTHGFVLDGNGRKMAKSEGNVVEPKTVQSKYNTDVLRLWSCAVNYGDEVRLGDEVLKTCADYYFKLRNTLKYLLGNTYGFNVDYEPSLNKKELDVFENVNKFKTDAKGFYEECNFRGVLNTTMNWVSEFSKYLDMETKTYLYEYSVGSNERLNCQYVMKHALETFMKVLAPMCSFLAEDAYQNYEYRKFDSVFMEEL